MGSEARQVLSSGVLRGGERAQSGRRPRIATCARRLLPLAALVTAPVRPAQELRKVCDDEGIDTKGLVEKEEYVKKIKAHFGIKEEL